MFKAAAICSQSNSHFGITGGTQPDPFRPVEIASSQGKAVVRSRKIARELVARACVAAQYGVVAGRGAAPIRVIGRRRLALQ